MLFQNILVPYDGSKFANHAFKVALDMAKKYNSKVTIVTVLGRYVIGSWYVDNRIAEAEIKGQRSNVRKQFEKLTNIAKKSGVSLNSKIIDTENIGKAIVNYAKSKKIDLVVMGSHGRTGWDKLVLGSIANGVSNRVHCPILIVK